MRNEIINLINGSYLKGVIRDSILNIEDFGEFLSEVLKLVTVVLEKDIQYDEAADSKINADGFTAVSDVTKNMIQMETISAFSEGVEGKYSGVIEFNMFLSKDRGESCVGRFEKDPKSKNSVNKNNGSKPGKLQKKLKTTVVLSTIFIALFGFMAADAVTNAQSGKENFIATKENTNAQMKEAEATPICYEETKEGKDTYLPGSEVESEKDASIEAQTPTNDVVVETSPEVESEPKAEQESNKNNGENAEKVSVADSKPSKGITNDSSNNTGESKTITGESPENNETEKGTESSTTTNTTNTSNTGTIVNNIDNSGDTIIDGDIIIEGDKNVVGKGSNIFINVE
ncbi:MAG: hypothetical protein BWY74_03128 [Firmicutes bacterium ADurb.Bin419]|nr:MAG: hypothetical protein BWY74_03128 [Firmicutes bacterium ADurb.Bin419]